MTRIFQPELPARKQSGAVSIGIAMLILFILGAAIASIMNIAGTAVVDAAVQEQQVSALFIAESGLERAQGVLSKATNSTDGSVCTGLSGANYSVGSRGGVFNLSASASGCDGSNLNCTGCTITSTGVLGNASRTVVRVLSVSHPTGGASGCGGGGSTSGTCPYTGTGYNSSDYHATIDQTIQVKNTEVPAILLSNLAYLRHPQGGANNVNAAGCVLVTIAGSTQCVTQWNDESNTSSGQSVVGSRGASVLVTDSNSYTLSQTLDSDSLHAAVGGKIGGASLAIVGSYWNDSATSGNGTVANNATATGKTNNGAFCSVNNGTANCPVVTSPPSAIPNPPSAGSSQSSHGWCYAADTLFLGFSGKSSNGASGSLTSFNFGTSPVATPVTDGTVAYPVVASGVNSSLYSTLWFINNPVLSSSEPSTVSATSGTGFTGNAGASFTGTISKSSTQLTVSASGFSGTLRTGDTITGGNLDANTKICSQQSGTTGQAGTYTVASNCTTLPGQRKATTSASLTANSITLIATNITNSSFAVGDSVFSGTTNLATITGISGSGTGPYTLTLNTSISPLVAATLATDGTTVTTSSPISTALPANTYISVVSGTGTLTNAKFQMASVLSSNSFVLKTRPSTPLSNTQICGGICAFFDQTSPAATTTFTLGFVNTAQWAAGMTCMKGVDTSTIVGLKGTGVAAKSSAWYEPVR